MASTETLVPADQLQVTLSTYRRMGYTVTTLPDGRYWCMGLLAGVRDSIYLKVI
jgi:hypothetical protein